MDPIEKVIRNAFARGNVDDRAFREKVYRSAFTALKRALEANPNVTPEVADHRRTALLRKIAEIESEFVPALPPEPSVAPPPVPSPEHPAASHAWPEATARAEAPDVTVAGARAPAVEAAPARHRGDDPALDAPVRDDGFSPRLDPADREVVAADGRDDDLPDERPRRGRGWAGLFIGATLVAAVGMGLWWAYDSGFFRPGDAGDGSVPNPPITFDDEDFDPGEIARPPRPPVQADGLEGWLVVFDATDPTLVAAPGGATAEARSEDGAAYLRIRSGPDGAPVLFDVGQGILEQISGRRAVFAIVARSEEDVETQISVDCNFAELGDCGRRRYIVGPTREEFLFEVELPAVRPGAGGTIAINPDVTNERKPVDIFAIRVSPAG